VEARSIRDGTNKQDRSADFADSVTLMKILFLAHRTPYPPNKGEKIRSYHLLSLLAERHHVTAVYWVDHANDLEHYRVLENICRGSVVPVRLNPLTAKLRGFVSMFRGRSFSEGYFFSREFQLEVDRLVGRERFDLVYVFSAPMAQYVNACTDIPVAVDFVDVDSEKWGQLAALAGFPVSWFFRIEKERLGRYEIDVSRWCRWSLFVSEAEAKLFSDIAGSENIVALPNGVHSDLLHLSSAREYPTQTTQREFAVPEDRALKLVFAGTMNYLPNIDAVSFLVHEILPLIQREYPNVAVDIVGRCPPRRLRKLGRRRGVRVLGEVDDVRSHLLQADVSVAPMRIARGIQNKILEAMAMGIPVVTTSAGATGIDAKVGEELLIGDTPESFAHQVIRLLRDRRFGKEIGRKARDRVVQCYNWKSIGQQLEGLIVGGVSKSQQVASRN
jgi:sugar transferase (PEP-CTERM/EpsH1 system associated)